MVIRAIVTDIDGTLLRSNGTISETTLEVLRSFNESGVLVFTATARPPTLVFRKGEAPENVEFLTERGVYYSGALVVDKKRTYSCSTMIQPDIVGILVERLVDFREDLQVVLQLGEGLHSFRHRVPATDLPRWGVSTEDLLEIGDAVSKDTFKVMAYGERGDPHDRLDLVSLRDLLAAELSNELSIILADNACCLQVTHASASKSNGVRQILRLYDIEPDEVIVFGDDCQDACLLSDFRNSFAMGNARSAIREMANSVTLSNDLDGIAHALEQLAQASGPKADLTHL